MIKVEPTVTILWATPNPAEVVCMAASQTVKQHPDFNGSIPSLIGFLYNAEHRSVLEHAVASIRLEGVSRAFMAQITRHRLASYTCSSQHYQNYSKYPVIESEYTERMEMAIDDAMAAYDEAIKNGIPKDVARMVLPEGMTVNMIMTANAREWAEILHQRLCDRNTIETHKVCKEIRLVLYDWFPELFQHVGPQCYEERCKQGKMRCGNEA